MPNINFIAEGHYFAGEIVKELISNSAIAEIAEISNGEPVSALTFGDSVERIKVTNSESLPNLIHCNADFYGTAVHFELQKDPAANNFMFPSRVSARCGYVPEIVPHSGEKANCYDASDVLTGLTISVSPDGCILSIASDKACPQLDQLYTISFRHEVQDEILFSGIMRLKKITQCPPDKIDLTFCPESIVDKKNHSDNCFGKIMYPLDKTDSSLDLEYDYMKGKDEYEEILKLRHHAYSLAGKTAQNATYMDMADKFDENAIIIAAKYRGEIVGSVRLMLHNTNDVTEHGRYVDYPKDFPPITQVAEGSRLCVAPKFSGRGVTYGLLTCMIVSALINGRKTIFSGAAGTLLDFYQKCGSRLTRVKYQNTSLAGLTHELMLMDIPDIVTARKIGVKHWNKLMSKVVNFIIENNFIDLNEQERTKIEFYRYLGLLVA